MLTNSNVSVGADWRIDGVVVSIIFSVHYLFAKKILISGVSPYALSAFRGVLGGLIILIVARKKIQLKSIKENIWAIIFVAGMGFFLNQIFFMQGLKRTSAINTALISNTIPIFSLIFAWFIKLEKMSFRKCLGISISFLCVSFLVFSSKKEVASDSGEFLGNILVSS